MNQNQSRRGSSLCQIISSSGKCMSYLVSTGCDTLQPFCQQTWGTWWRLPGAGCAAYWFTDWLIGCWNQPSSRSSSPLWELKKHGCLECWETPVKSRKPTNQLAHTHPRPPLRAGRAPCYTSAIGCRVRTNAHTQSSNTIPPGLGNTGPPLLRLLLRLLLSIQSEVFITTTSHIPFKVTHSLRERLVILISTSDSLSLCVSQMQAESWCLFNALFNRRVEWVRSHQAAGLQQIKVSFIFFLPGGCSRLFKAAQGCSRQFLTLGWVLNSCCVIRTNNETLCWNNYGSFYSVGDCL